MGNTLMSLLVKLGVDSSALTTGLEGAETASQRSATNIGRDLSDVGASMQRTGAAMTATMTLPILAAGGVAVNAASDLDESMNKVRVVFGDAADSMITFSETSATAMGMSQQTALEASGTFGNLFASMGIGAQPTADMTQGLVQLAADLASFNNIDPTVALEKLRAGMIGEAEPLRALGVNITAAATEAMAMSMGLGDAAGNFTTAELATARYALIMEQTTLAQGDFARTSDGMANSTRIAKAEISNLSAEFGAELIPLVRDFLTQAIPFLKSLNDMDPAAKKAILVILGVVAALGPLITILGTVVGAIGSLVTAFSAGGWAMTLLTSIGTFLSGTVLPAIGAAIAAIGAPVIALIAAIGLLIATIIIFGEDAVNTVKSILGIVGVGVQLVIWKLQEIKTWLDTKIIQAFNTLKTAWTNMWTNIKNAVTSAKTNVINAVQDLVNRIGGFFDRDWWSIGRDIIQGIANGIRDCAGWLADAAWDAASSALDAAKSYLGIHSPSSVMKMEVGWNMGLGVAEGWRESLKSAASSMSMQLGEMVTVPAGGISYSGGAAGTGTQDSGAAGAIIAAIENTRLDAEELGRIIVNAIQRGSK